MRRIHLTPAEVILQSLGVTRPEDIDLEAIAWTQGAVVKRRPLLGCEARIIGRGDRAVISVNSRSSLQRQRFSLGHELGHWRHHRGRALFCGSGDIGLSKTFSQQELERVANKFSADLLMPGFIFDEVARSYRKLDFSTVDAIAAAFEVSRSAAAIRLIQRDHFPAFLICHGSKGRKWFFRSPQVPGRWFPRDDLDSESGAFDVQFGRTQGTKYLSKIGADAWFDRFDASRYEVREQSVPYSGDCSLTLVVIEDGRMLTD